MTAWLCLLLAGLFEIIWAMTLKYSDGFTRLWPSLATAAAVALSFGFMAVSLKTLPFGTVYAVWGGIGAAGTIAATLVAAYPWAVSRRPAASMTAERVARRLSDASSRRRVAS